VEAASIEIRKVELVSIHSALEKSTNFTNNDFLVKDTAAASAKFLGFVFEGRPGKGIW